MKPSSIFWSNRYALLLPAVSMLLAFPPNLGAQESSLSISPLVDTLNAQILRQPDDPTVRRKLIDAYTLAFQPELALLEILDPFAAGKTMAADAGVKGRVQFSLEQIGPATRSLQQAYLESPSDETLILLAVLDYANNQESRGLFELKRLRKRLPTISVELLRLYEQFYLNGRRIIAHAAGNSLRQSDPVAYGTYFPHPNISILSPSNGFATEAKQTSVIWEVSHSRPLRTVRIGEEALFERGEDLVINSNESVQRSFTHLFRLHEGRNPVIIEATDVFGTASAETVIVNGLSFDRLKEWNSPIEDSLRFAIQFLRNYIPDSLFAEGGSRNHRVLIIAGPSADSARLAGQALFWHEFMTNPVTGLANTEQVKILIGGRVEEQNVSIVMDEWLLKGATFQSITFVYLAGDWRITEREWLMKDRAGGWMNLRPRLERLRSLATAGVVLVFDGKFDDRRALESGLAGFSSGSSVPLKVIIFPDDGAWTRNLVARSLTPDELKAAETLSPFLTSEDLSGAGAYIHSSSEQNIVIAKNPARRVLQEYQGLLRRLDGKLSQNRVAVGSKAKILKFSQDWRRYNEVTRYLNERLSLGDFLIRVEEYESRTGEKP